MSRNCRIPASPARYLTARVRNAREVRATTAIPGKIALYASPASRSTA
jgi:hypothetical protein